jgi:GNAT superfamily N-acetyltransferase
VIEIAIVSPTRLYDIRRRVLRGNRPEAQVRDPRDDESDALHMAAIENDVVVGSGSVYPSTWPLPEPMGLTYQLRYLAVDPERQRLGIGETLMNHLEAELIVRGARALWANGRDSALAFYTATGWTIVPDSAHLSPETQLPHHVIVKRLSS